MKAVLSTALLFFYVFLITSAQILQELPRHNNRVIIEFKATAGLH